MKSLKHLMILQKSNLNKLILISLCFSKKTISVYRWKISLVTNEWIITNNLFSFHVYIKPSRPRKRTLTSGRVMIKISYHETSFLPPWRPLIPRRKTTLIIWRRSENKLLKGKSKMKPKRSRYLSSRITCTNWKNRLKSRSLR